MHGVLPPANRNKLLHYKLKFRKIQLDALRETAPTENELVRKSLYIIILTERSITNGKDRRIQQLQKRLEEQHLPRHSEHAFSGAVQDRTGW